LELARRIGKKKENRPTDGQDDHPTHSVLTIRIPTKRREHGEKKQAKFPSSRKGWGSPALTQDERKRGGSAKAGGLEGGVKSITLC